MKVPSPKKNKILQIYPEKIPMHEVDASYKQATTQNGFIKMQRSLEELFLNDLDCFLLVTQIAFRAKRTSTKFDKRGIKNGEALIGDFTSIGLTRQRYRSALTRLVECHQLITIKTTNKGTIATLLNTEAYDINLEENNQQDLEKITIEQPSNNHQITTNKEVKKLRIQENNNSSSCCPLAVASFNPQPQPSVEVSKQSLSDLQRKKEILANLEISLDCRILSEKNEYTVEDIERVVEVLKYAKDVKDIDAYFTSALKKKWKPTYPPELLQKKNELDREKKEEDMRIYEHETIKIEIIKCAKKHKNQLKEGCKIVRRPDPKEVGTGLEEQEYLWFISPEVENARKITWDIHGLHYLRRVVEAYKKEPEEKPLHHFKGAKD